MKPATVRTLWLLYAAFILYGAIIPFRFDAEPGSIVRRLQRVPLNPFVSPETGRRVSIPDAAQNVLLFMPFGALTVLAAGQRRSKGMRIAGATIGGAALACIVEFLQLLTSDRVAATSDVLMNTTGALAGAMAAGWTTRFVAAAVQNEDRSGTAAGRDLRPVLATGGALTVFFLEPFDLTLDVSTTVSRVRQFVADPWQYTVPRDEGIAFLLAALFVMAAASYMATLERRWAGRTAALVGVVTVCFLEATQVVNASRAPGLFDATAGSLGAVAGAGLWVVAGRVMWPRLWDGVLIAMTMVAAGLLMLSPFQWSGAFNGFAMLPDFGQGAFVMLSQVIELALAYFPLGFCFAYGRDPRERPVTRALVTTLAIAVPLWLLHGWISGNASTLPGLLTPLLGATVGVLAAGRPRAAFVETFA